MRVLILHQNFPGQFRHVAQHWSQTPGMDVLAIGRETAPGLAGVRCLRYRLHRAPRPEQHHYLRQMEQAVLHGQAVARLLLKLKAKGYRPDAILAHPGWGETLYVKDVFPDARLIHFCEWYYSSNDADWDFDPEFPATFDDKARVRTWNALHTLNLENCDAGVTPTHWQHSRHPAAYRDKIAVIHEGIDTEVLAPPWVEHNVIGRINPASHDVNASSPVGRVSTRRTTLLDSSDGGMNPALRNPTGRGIDLHHVRPDSSGHPNDAHKALTLPNGTTLTAGDPVITYVARNLEPYRGFHSFMRALEITQKQHKHCHAVIVGGDEVSYGKRPTDAPNWREKMLREVTLDPQRTHFLGKVPYDTYRKVLQVSAAHVYLTYPFVLSWSMLEAMASGCLIIGSKTPPVEEVIQDRKNGVLVNFFDRQDIAERVIEALQQPARFLPLRVAAANHARAHYARSAGLDAYQLLLSGNAHVIHQPQIALEAQP